jgi:hypothetical protein
LYHSERIRFASLAALVILLASQVLDVRFRYDSRSVLREYSSDIVSFASSREFASASVESIAFARFLFKFETSTMINVLTAIKKTEKTPKPQYNALLGQ